MINIQHFRRAKVIFSLEYHGSSYLLTPEVASISRSARGPSAFRRSSCILPPSQPRNKLHCPGRSIPLGARNPFPAALNDVEDVVKWVLEQRDEFDRNRLAISGFSAGGTLALVAASTSFPKGTFRSVLAFYPLTNLVTYPGLKTAPDTSGKPILAFIERAFNQTTSRQLANKRPTCLPVFCPTHFLETFSLLLLLAIL
jgi:alpha/beta hydrolase fold